MFIQLHMRSRLQSVLHTVVPRLTYWLFIVDHFISVQENQKWRYVDAHTGYRANWEFRKSTREIYSVSNYCLMLFQSTYLVSVTLLKFCQSYSWSLQCLSQFTWLTNVETLLLAVPLINNNNNNNSHDWIWGINSW